MILVQRVGIVVDYCCLDSKFKIIFYKVLHEQVTTSGMKNLPGFLSKHVFHKRSRGLNTEEPDHDSCSQSWHCCLSVLFEF